MAAMALRENARAGGRRLREVWSQGGDMEKTASAFLPRAEARPLEAKARVRIIIFAAPFVRLGNGKSDCTEKRGCDSDTEP